MVAWAQMNDADFMLEKLRDGTTWTTMQIVEASIRERGCGLTPHSRASDLRKRGYNVVCEPAGRVGTRNVYRYSLSGNSAIPLTAAATESVADEPSPPSQAEFPESEQLPLDLPGSVYRPEAA